MSIKHFFFDMDDTFTNTDRYLKEAIRNAIIKHEPQMLPLFELWLLDGKTMLQLPMKLKDYSYEYGLKDGGFMVNVEPSPLLADRSAFISFLELLKEKGISCNIVTHRGWHPKGLIFTKEWIDRQGLSKYFDNIVILDSTTNPSKTDYLEQHYQDFIILDDNPLHNLHIEHPKDDRLLIYTGIGNYEAYQHQTKVANLAQVRDRVLDMIF